jgi:hypothetical protein
MVHCSAHLSLRFLVSATQVGTNTSKDKKNGETVCVPRLDFMTFDEAAQLDFMTFDPLIKFDEAASETHWCTRKS